MTKFKVTFEELTIKNDVFTEEYYNSTFYKKVNIKNMIFILR